MEDYTNKYKGEQVEVALFGGEYQDGVLTAYCYVEDVAHIELNGHILIPLQNIASLHCSSRCDAPEPDWPPHGLAEDDDGRARRRGVGRGRAPSRRRRANLLKAWLLLVVARARDGLRRLAARRVPARRCSSSARSCCSRAALYWYADRIVMGMVGARELLPGEAPALHSTVERLVGAGRRRQAAALCARRRVSARALGRPRRAAAAPALAVSVGLLGVASPAELEGIVAHELAHLRHRDVLVQTIAVIVAAALVEASRLGGFLQRALLFVLGPLAASFVHLLLSPKREYEADRFAAELCGSPHGLADALLRLEQAMELVASRRARRPSRSTRRTRSPRKASRRSSSRIRRSASACAGCARSTRSGARSCAPPETAADRRRPRLGPGREEMGGVLLSRELALRVPSALAGLTSLFGMGRGVSPPL